MSQVAIFKIQKKGGQTLPGGGRLWMLNLSRCANPVSFSAVQTKFSFRQDTRLPGAPPFFIVDGAYPGIAATLNTSYTYGLTVNVAIEQYNRRPAVGNRVLQVDNIAFGFSDLDDPTKTVLFYQDSNSHELVQILIDQTLNDFSDLLNADLADNPTTWTLGACTATSQAATLANGIASWKYFLEVFNGAEWVPVAVKTGITTGAQTFTVNPGDIQLNDEIRIRGIDAAETHSDVYVEGEFACAGASGSGSGAGTGDCSTYAYFDGNGYDSTFRTLNFGDTCTLGYAYDIANDQQFTSMVLSEVTTSNPVQVLLPAGTYYARVRNVSNTTRFSPTLTFIVP